MAGSVLTASWQNSSRLITYLQTRETNAAPELSMSCPIRLASMTKGSLIFLLDGVH